jgi:hypothetical protein
VADFGLSRVAVKSTRSDNTTVNGEEEDYYRTAAGTFPIRWTAPECMESMKFNQSSDVWSFGVTMWECYSDGDRPYGEMSNMLVMIKVEQGYTLEKPLACTPAAYTVLAACLESDVAQRPAFANVVERLEALSRADEGANGANGAGVAGAGAPIGIRTAVEVGGVARYAATATGGAAGYTTAGGTAAGYAGTRDGAGGYAGTKESAAGYTGAGGSSGGVGHATANTAAAAYAKENASSQPGGGNVRGYQGGGEGDYVKAVGEYQHQPHLPLLQHQHQQPQHQPQHQIEGNTTDYSLASRKPVAGELVQPQLGTGSGPQQPPPQQQQQQEQPRDRTGSTVSTYDGFGGGGVGVGGDDVRLVPTTAAGGGGGTIQRGNRKPSLYLGFEQGAQPNDQDETRL